MYHFLEGISPQRRNVRLFLFFCQSCSVQVASFELATWLGPHLDNNGKERQNRTDGQAYLSPLFLLLSPEFNNTEAVIFLKFSLGPASSWRLLYSYIYLRVYVQLVFLVVSIKFKTNKTRCLIAFKVSWPGWVSAHVYVGHGTPTIS